MAGLPALVRSWRRHADQAHRAQTPSLFNLTYNFKHKPATASHS